MISRWNSTDAKFLLQKKFVFNRSNLKTCILLVFPEASVSELIRGAVEASYSVAEKFIVDSVHTHSIFIQLEVARQIAEFKLEEFYLCKKLNTVPACFEIVDNDSKMTNVLAGWLESVQIHRFEA